MKTSTSATLAVLAVAALSLVDARQQYVSRIPNGANVAGVDALGHVDTSGGGARNSFGQAFGDAGEQWTVALCQADSDGDGQTNGQELGDPCCEWTVGATPQYTTGVSAPGDASSTASSSLWASISCGGSGSSSNSTTTTTATPSTTTATPSTTTATPSTTTATPSTTTPAPASSATSASLVVVAGVAAGIAALAQL